MASAPASSRPRLLVATALLGLLAAGCARGDAELADSGMGKRFLSPEWAERAPRTVAVLPVMNQTLDLDAPEVFRPYLHQVLAAKGYSGPSKEEVDELLLTRDIREAGQVKSLTPEELGKLLGADAVLYSEVLDWSTTYLGVYASIAVSARFELVDAATATRLWVDEDEQVERKIANVLDKRRAAQEAAELAAYAALRAYEPFAQRVVMNSFASLPDARWTPLEENRHEP